MGQFKHIYEIVIDTMKRLKNVSNHYGFNTEDEIEFFEEMKASIRDEIDAHIIKLQTKSEIPNKLELLKEAFTTFDWFYEQSDDHGVWQSGNREAKRIQNLIDSLDYQELAQAQELYDKFHPKYGEVFFIPTPEEAENVFY